MTHEPHDHRPVATTSFPWTRLGLVLGTAFAALFAAIAKDDPPPPVVAPVAVEAPVVVDIPAPAPVPAFAPVDAPWPPDAHVQGRSRHNASHSETGTASMSVAALEDFYEIALASCAPTTVMTGKATSLFCETASDESRATIVEGTTSTTSWLQTSRTKFELPRPTGSLDSSLGGSCGWTMRFVALPPGARVSGSGGSTESGHCSFEVDGLPSLAWSTMLHNVFRPGTAVHKRQLDDGEVTRWTGEGWDGGWWRVDVVSASANAQAPADQQHALVELTRWAPGERAWVPPMHLEEKIEALEGCWEPCSLALRSPARELGPDMRAQMKAGDIIDRCLYECRGTEQAPAVLEPAARAFR